MNFNTHYPCSRYNTEEFTTKFIADNPQFKIGDSFKDYVPPYKSNVLEPWAGQLSVAEFINEYQYTIILAKWGAGKGKMAVFASIIGAVDSGNTRKYLFSAPGTDPCLGYCKSNGDDIRFDYKGEEWTWNVMHKFFGGEFSTKRLKTFLTKDIKSQTGDSQVLSGMSAAITHGALVQKWEELTEEEKIKAVHCTTFIIDECHHSKSSNEYEYTKLGRFLQEVLDINDPTTRIVLLTATYHRGDDMKILSPKHYKKFKKKNLPIDVYLSLIGIEKFNFDFIAYKQDPVDVIVDKMKVFRDKKHIVVLPPIGVKFRDDSTLKKHIERYSEIFGAEYVLDLTTQGKCQFDGKKLLKDNPEKYKVVVACSLFNEGYDWPPAQVLHNTCSGASLNRSSQVMGRLFRRYANKKEIWHFTYMEYHDDNCNLRDIFADRLNSLMLAISISDILNPIRVPVIAGKESYFMNNDKVALIDVMSEEEYIRLTNDMIVAYESLDPTKDEATKLVNMKGRLDKIANKYYKYVSDFFIKDAFKFLLRKLAIRHQIIASGDKNRIEKIDKIGIDFIRNDHDFDKIFKKEGMLGSLIFGTVEPIEKESFYKLKEIIDNNDWCLAMELEDYATDRRSYHTEIAPVRKYFSGDVIGKWVSFIPSDDWTLKGFDISSITNHYAFVVKQEDSYLDVIYYKGVIKHDDNKISLTLNDKTFILCGEYWRHNFLPETMTPWKASKRHLKYFLSNNGINGSIKKVPQVECRIKPEWIVTTFT